MARSARFGRPHGRHAYQDAVLRRFHRTAASEPTPATAPADAPAPVASGFTLDTDGARVSWLGHALDLTRYEFGLLALLVRHPGRIYSREQLMDLVWHEALDSADRTVDTHIKTLRAKLRGQRERVGHPEERDRLPPLHHRRARHRPLRLVRQRGRAGLFALERRVPDAARRIRRAQHAQRSERRQQYRDARRRADPARRRDHRRADDRETEPDGRAVHRAQPAQDHVVR
ncbi:winged helix-turn-helix domain-containing protein, partial [Burkholderia cenocepacia]|nr:winged helix-turn-helix domain-containing protein [Burkholderia cenocepacia]MDR5670797.1 winged helix-turn-helix domain-containing protein [Burkholderia cenocepacia]